MNKVEQLVLEFFDGNEKKMRLWMKSRNPLLGNISPNKMIKVGRYDRLLKWVKSQLYENEDPD